MRSNDDLIKANILIVDDEETNVLLLQRILQRAGYESITTTTDPTRVRTIHHEFQPDIIPEARRRALSMGARDFLLKPFDQDEALLRIRNLLETRRLHLRLMSQNESLEERVRERTIELERSLETLRRTSEQRRMLLAHLADVQRTAASALGKEGPEGGDGAEAEVGAAE